MTGTPLRVIFMGTPDFSAAALQSILDSHHEVICVYTQPPRPKGRGQKMQSSSVQILAEAAGIPVRHPLSLKKDADARQEFIDLKADVAVVAAYGLILPRDVLDAPKYGCLNIHASLLPRWRGASPIQRAIWAGDAETGITIMQMEEGLDTGPMILKKSIPIGSETTTPSLHDELAVLGAGMIADVLDGLSKDGAVKATAQDETLTSYASLLSKEDGRVDWTQDAEAIDRQIRALTPWPGVWTLNTQGVRLKITGAEPTNEKSDAAPGTMIDKIGHIACGGGSVLKILSVQPDNGKPMDVAAAINGHYFSVGAVFV